MAVHHDGMRRRPETYENLATKARRHKGFIDIKTFFVTLRLGVFVAIFIAVSHDNEFTPGEE